MSKVLFGDLEKGQVLAALYNGAKPSKKYITEYDPKPMSEIEGKKMTLKTSNFSYIKGRLLLIIFVENTFNSKLYNKSNGNGTAEQIIESLRKTHDVNNEIIRLIHQKNLEMTIEEIKSEY